MARKHPLGHLMPGEITVLGWSDDDYPIRFSVHISLLEIISDD